MLLGNALADLFGVLASEINSSSSLVVALALIGAGVCLVLGSRRRKSKQNRKVAV